MKMLIPGILLATVTLATPILTAQAQAATSRYPGVEAQEVSCPPGMAVDVESSGEVNGSGPCVRIQRDDVVTGGRILGRDPDPFIRGQILREQESGN